MSRPRSSLPDHLNSTGCRIGFSDGKGRGVFGEHDRSIGFEYP